MFSHKELIVLHWRMSSKYSNVKTNILVFLDKFWSILRLLTEWFSVLIPCFSQGLIHVSKPTRHHVYGSPGGDLVCGG